MWQTDWACRLITWQVQVGQLGSDTCHPCSGDTWHVCMTTRGRVRSADRADDVEELDQSVFDTWNQL
jgi:hypothetical protein